MPIGCRIRVLFLELQHIKIQDENPPRRAAGAFHHQCLLVVALDFSFWNSSIDASVSQLAQLIEMARALSSADSLLTWERRHAYATE